MTATVVDELLIKLGFDNSALSGSASKAEDIISQMTRRIGGVLGAVFSVDYLKNLITDTAKMGTKMSVLSKMTGEGVEKLQAFQQAVIRMGGSAEGFNGTITKLKDAIQDVAVTGGTGVGGLLAAVGISARDAKGNIKSYSETLLELSEILHKSDMPHAQFLARQFGIDDNTFLVLREGRKEVEANILAMQKLGVMTAKSADEQFKFDQRLKNLNQSYTIFKYTLADRLLPVLNDVGDKLSWIGINILPVVSKALGTIQDKLGISNKAIIEFIGGFVLFNSAIASVRLLAGAFAFLGVSISATLAPFLALAGALMTIKASYDYMHEMLDHSHTSEMSEAFGGVNNTRNPFLHGSTKSHSFGQAEADNKIQKLKNVYGQSSLLPKAFADTLDQTAYAHMMKESGGNPSKIGYAMYNSGGKWQYKRDAHGNKIPEAFGLFQLRPETASEALGRKITGQQLLDPELNKQARDAYLRQGLEKSGGDIKAALAYYNGGPGGLSYYQRHKQSRYDYAESILNNARHAPINNTALAATTPQLRQAQNIDNHQSQSSNTRIDNLNVHGVKDLKGILDQAKKYSDPFNLTRATNNFQTGLSS